MCTERYIDPFTDFGFKRMFGSDRCKSCVIKNLAKLSEIPERLDDELFRSFFQLAEVSKLSPEEYEAYEASLKRQRDNYNVVVTAREEGMMEEKIKNARAMKQFGDPIDKISIITGLSPEEIVKL
ncbi:MAG: PD-(D/E)XK nuclease family transposase [Bacteroidales bacterium]|nr:PD-(D/E)XK nuclease family transposase [Bacteroidales bacterium]